MIQLTRSEELARKIGVWISFVLIGWTCLGATPASGDSPIESLRFDRIPVQELLFILTDLEGYDLSSSGVVPGTVSINVGNRSMEQTLDEVLFGSGYTYWIEGRIVRIVPADVAVTRTIPLNYVDAETTVENLREIAGEALLAYDKNSNSITIVGTARDLRTLAGAVRGFDQRPRQVQIVGRMIEINLLDTKSLGIDWTAGWSDALQEARGVTNVGGPAIGTLSLSYSRITDTELHAVLDAILTETDSRIVSNPMLVASNRETAKILVGERVPFTRYSTETQTGNVLEEVDFVDVGIRLEVTPTISSDSLIILQVFAEISEVLDQEVQGIPRIGSREAETRVAVKSGETAIIAGLRRNQTIESTARVPLLSSIPFLGRLFRSDRTSVTQTELIIFLTPTVVEAGVVPDVFTTGDAEKSLTPASASVSGPSP